MKKVVSSNMIFVGIIEDEEEIRDGIQRYLRHQSNFACDLAAESVEDFLDLLTTATKPDVILMDIGLPGMSGISGIQIIKERFPEIGIIMLTVYNDPNKIFESLRAGASGYLLKNTPFDKIKEGIQELSTGGAPMSRPIARKVIEYFYPSITIGNLLGNKRKAQSNAELTDKEKEVVIGLVDGLSYKLIADRMGISIETVRFHIKNVYEKLHVHSKAEVIAKSLKGEI